MGRCENFNCKHDNWFGTYSPLYINTLRNFVVKIKYIRKDYDGYYGNNITYNNIELHGGIGMKNREKFREEIIRSLSGANKDNFDCEMCDFIQKHMLPYFGDIYNVEYKCNAELDCDICGMMFSFWIDEEYTENPKPEVDWSNVPVDTLVQVRDDESDKWALRYFKWFVRGHRTPFVTWAGGATSKTSETCTEYWKYCELVEDEDK